MTKKREYWANDTLVFDWSTSDFFGIYSMRTKTYKAYHGKEQIRAIEYLAAAKTVVTWDGYRYDVPEIKRYYRSATGSALVISGAHHDMLVEQSIINDPPRPGTRPIAGGLKLSEAFKKYFDQCPMPEDGREFLDEQNEGHRSNWSDCYMARKLYELWSRGLLRICV